MFLKPKNGFYMTEEDFPSFQDDFQQTYLNATGEESDGLKVLNATFCVTEKCNLACTYCYECHKTDRIMDWYTAKKCVDYLLSREDLIESKPAICLDFIGGEPLLEIDLIEKIVTYFQEETLKRNLPWGYYWVGSISTNGVLYNTPRVQNFIKKFGDRFSITVSIDGNKDLHDSCRTFPDGTGSYELAKNAAESLLKIHPFSGTKITLSPENIKYFSESIKHLSDLGYKIFHANPVFENVWHDEDAAILYNEYIKIADWIIEEEKYKDSYFSFFQEYNVQRRVIDDEELRNHSYCGGNGEMIAFGVDGKIYPCLRYMKMSLTKQPERPIGDIKLGLYSDKKTTAWFQKLQNVNTWDSADDECRECFVLEHCPTCIAYQYDYFGNPNRKVKFHCKMIKAEMAANYYYWKKLEEKLKLDLRIERIVPKQSYEVD